MSDAPRMPLARASAAATLLFELWGMNTPDCMVAGSVRRRSMEVGDLDLVAPLPHEGAKDPLCDRIDATVAHEGSLFGSDSPTVPFTKVIAGLKPHFKAANLRVQLKGVIDGPEGDVVIIPVQVCRYTPHNRGWMEVMKTGPRDFNIWLLGKWKERFNIATRGESADKDEGAEGGGIGTRALIDNHLVDQWGKVVPVTNERAVFDLCGVSYIEPWDRQATASHQKSSSSRERRETMR